MADLVIDDGALLLRQEQAEARFTRVFYGGGEQLPALIAAIWVRKGERRLHEGVDSECIENLTKHIMWLQNNIRRLIQIQIKWICCNIILEASVRVSSTSLAY